MRTGELGSGQARWLQLTSWPPWESPNSPACRDGEANASRPHQGLPWAWAAGVGGVHVSQGPVSSPKGYLHGEVGQGLGSLRPSLTPPHSTGPLKWSVPSTP